MNSSEPLAQGGSSVSGGRLTGPAEVGNVPPCSSSLSIRAPPFLSLLSSLFQNLVFKFHSLQGFFVVIDKRRCGETALWLPVNSLFMHLEAKGVLTDGSGAHGPVRLPLPRHGVVTGWAPPLPWHGRGRAGAVLADTEPLWVSGSAMSLCAPASGTITAPLSSPSAPLPSLPRPGPPLGVPVLHSLRQVSCRD